MLAESIMFKLFARDIFAKIRTGFNVFKSWIANNKSNVNVKDLINKLKQKANEFKNKGLNESELQNYRLIEGKTELDLELIGNSMANALAYNVIDYSNNKEKREEQILSLAMFLDNAGVDNLAEILQKFIPDRLTPKQIHTVGYIFIKNIIEYLNKNIEKGTIAEFIPGEIEKDIKNIIKEFGKKNVYVSKSKGNYPKYLNPFWKLGLKIDKIRLNKPEIDIAHFEFIKKEYPMLIWMGVDSYTMDILFVITEDLPNCRSGGLHIRFEKIAKSVSPDRQLSLLILANDNCFFANQIFFDKEIDGVERKAENYANISIFSFWYVT